MTKKVEAAFAGNKHDAIQAPRWDYDAAKHGAVNAGGYVFESLGKALLRMKPTVACLYKIGEGLKEADVKAGQDGVFYLDANEEISETVDPTHVVAIRKLNSSDDDGSMYIVPAVEV